MARALLIDVGNYRCKWRADERRGDFVIARETFARQLSRAFDDLRVDAVVIGCVGGDALAHELSAFCRRRWSLAPNFLRAKARQCGLQNKYHRPDALGVDRWLAMLGARAQMRRVDAKFARALIVVDAGTAVTVDLVAADGEFVGGVIMPGVALMRDALRREAEKIQVDAMPDANHIAATATARDTEGGVMHGAHFAAAGGVDLAVKAQMQLAPQAEVAVTGGDAKLCLALMTQRARHFENLVLDGMQHIHEMQDA